MEILKLVASYKNYIWGGNKLKEYYNKKASSESIAETWELSCHQDGPSMIQNETYKNKTLKDYLDMEENKKLLGSYSEQFKDFPILIKFIDTKKPISIQVHPDNNYALKHENQYGKTEMWYILDCEPDAFIYYGFKKEISKEKFKEAIKQNKLEVLLNKVYVKKEDVFFIEAGTIHAIGEGITLIEIQQNSNITYRIYDYDRVDLNGRKRELHIDKAIDVLNFRFTGKSYQFGSHIASCNYFEVDKFNIDRKEQLFKADETSFHSLIVLGGKGKVIGQQQEMIVQKGDSIFIPANFGNYIVKGNLTILKTIIPKIIK